MKKHYFLIFITLSGLLFGCSSIHEHGHRHPADDSNYQEHVEVGVPLPFDPIFCDLNDDKNISKDEMKMSNLCVVEGGGTLFATKPIASLGLKKGELLLTIDDGPNDPVTQPILDLLDQYNIKATFFIVGSRVASNKNLIRETIRRGHTIGNHTYSHNVKGITSSTIVDEVLSAHQALVSVLGQQPTGRLLFRAPGLGWSAPKAVSLNNNETTQYYVGPIHANLGTDAPRADWSCWSTGVSSSTCANYYFQDIVNAGRGIVLAHDIFYKKGQGNTYEMLKVLLERLDTEAGGIVNRNSTGLWRFVDIQDLSFLDQYEVGAQPITKPTVQQKTSDGFPLIQNFSNTNVFIRSKALVQQGVIADSSKIVVGSSAVKVAQLKSVADLVRAVKVAGMSFKMVRIEETVSGFESLLGQTVYIFAGAF